MVTPKPGCLKKVQFCAALALLLGAASAAAELPVPLPQMGQLLEQRERQLVERAEEAFARKLDRCLDTLPEEEEQASAVEADGETPGVGKTQLRVI